MADRESKRPNNLETGFNLGSINKVFTATAIRQLAAVGKLDLDSTLSRYWPDYPNPVSAPRIERLGQRDGLRTSNRREKSSDRMTGLTGFARDGIKGSSHPVHAVILSCCSAFGVNAFRWIADCRLNCEPPCSSLA